MSKNSNLDQALVELIMLLLSREFLSRTGCGVSEVADVLIGMTHELNIDLGQSMKQSRRRIMRIIEIESDESVWTSARVFQYRRGLQSLRLNGYLHR